MLMRQRLVHHCRRAWRDGQRHNGFVNAEAQLRPISSAGGEQGSAESREFTSWLATNNVDSRNLHESVRTYLGLTEGSQLTLSPQKRQHDVASNVFVNKVGDVAFWCFRSYGDALEQQDKEAVERVGQVMRELSPWGNMAKGDVWQHFYIRRFFLSNAPLQAFLELYNVHCEASTAAKERFLPLPSALLLREYCWRGRFHEAVKAFAVLRLQDHEKRSFTALLHESEQYDTLWQVYKHQEQLEAEKGVAAPLLDAFYILHALKELDERAELVHRFEQLTPQEQSRAKIQQLLANA
ncbi:hypothetical protein Poli38472_013480 [Pythium oligandrum]|uniref:Uncharacterized protein n=1 Tax=Pythium oligandrum TaxID=41045 RepID=A0A8K1FD74_PYTOL|nr:hypothetical protein Poli38472_013480 [Pythium oligandrum]|eukprot:TMW58006.1 hypothetical protein Poli38472_013480 [Pythium oligandrum]